MAATLTLLKLPILPNKPQLPRPSTTKLVPFPSIRSNSNLSSPNTHNSSFLDHNIDPLKPVFLSLTAITFPLFLNSKDALAAGGEFGDIRRKIICSRTPHCEGAFFFYTLWAGYLGWQWRRSRTIPETISMNSKTSRSKPNPVTPDGKPVEEASPSPVELQKQQLPEERKELIKGSYKKRHFKAGPILLKFGGPGTIGGKKGNMVQAGKLFSGPTFNFAFWPPQKKQILTFSPFP
uniref:Uncharacterized protein n=1 Tax=Phaseolus vulgaris TaxID=3885 RepID=T2DP35_PHAVU|nr:hypothetical protein [Phaseolus vulgaris]